MSTLNPINLCDLPEDVTHHIFDLLSPADIMSYGHLSQAARRTVSDPYVWRSAGRRHLAVVRPPPSPSPSSLSPAAEEQPLTPETLARLARSLTCHWSVSTGLFVAGVPVHRRSGFVCVTSRGGIEIPLEQDRSESAYVFGGRHHLRAVPTPTPSLALQFVLDPHGPFPVAGLQCRIIHGAEPDHNLIFVSNTDTDTDTDVMADADLDAEPEDKTDKNTGADSAESADLDGIHSFAPVQSLVKALVTIKVNEQVVHSVTCTPATQFTECQFAIPANVLVTKPGVNNLSVEYGSDSSAGYWLRDVSIASMISPLPELDDNVLEFPLAHAELNKWKAWSRASVDIDDTDQSMGSQSTYGSASTSASASASTSTSAASSSDALDVGEMESGTRNLSDARASLTGSRARGARVTALMLEQLGDRGHDLTHSNFNSHSSGVPHRHGKRESKGQQLGKGRPRHLHHKQNFHHRSPRAAHQVVRSRSSRTQR